MFRPFPAVVLQISEDSTMSTENNSLVKYMDLVRSIRIDHFAYAGVLNALDYALDSAGHSANPILLHIMGEYRTGKSCVLRDFMARHPRKRGDGGIQQVIVYAIVPHDGSVKGLLSALLRAFGDPCWARGSILDQTGRLLGFLRGTGCRMIILDEFQHLSDKGQKKRLDNTTDWLKNLLEDAPWALVAAGLPESSAVLNRNAQLGAGRSDATLTMPLFDWRKGSSRAEFRGILRAFVAEMHPFELPDLGGEELAFRTYLATNGRVGLLAKLMDRAVHNAIRAQTTKIRLQDISEAFLQAIWFAPRFPFEGGPFFCNLTGNENALIDAATQLADQDEAYRENGGQVVLHGLDANMRTQATERQRSRGRRKSAAGSHELRRAL